MRLFVSKNLCHSIGEDQRQLVREAFAIVEDRCISAFFFPVPKFFPTMGLPLDEVEDLLLRSSAYRQTRRVLIHEQSNVRGRPLTPLHGDHVGLLCTAGLVWNSRQLCDWRDVNPISTVEI